MNSLSFHLVQETPVRSNVSLATIESVPAETVGVPVATLVANPAGLIVATPVFPELHTTEPVRFC